MAIMTPNGHSLGYKRDLPDFRDYRLTLEVPKKPLPTRVDLRPSCPPVYDQGPLGSCTAQAIAGAIELEQYKQGAAFDMPSRLFIYYNERLIEGTLDSDAGAEIRDGFKSLHGYGYCDETAWPYDITQFMVLPNGACYTAAKLMRKIEYRRLPQTESQLRTCLASGWPFVFGFSVYESFDSPEVAETGIVPMPTSNEGMLGGHAVLCVGYDHAHRVFYCRNSWGPTWGLSGYFLMPYEYLLSSGLSADFWVLRHVTTDAPAEIVTVG